MKHMIALFLALALLLLTGCGTVVPLRKVQPAPAPEETVTEPAETEPAAPEEEEPAPAEEEPVPEPEEEEPVPEEAEETVPAEEPEEEPVPAETVEPAPEEPEEEEPVPEETEETGPEEEPEETAPTENEELRAIVTVYEESSETYSEDGETLLLRVKTALPRLRLQNGSLSVEARINKSLEEDLQVLEQAMTEEDGRHRLLSEAADLLYPQFAERGELDSFPVLEQSRMVEVGRCDRRVLSVVYRDYYYAGLAHGNMVSHAINYDLRTGKLLRFDDLSPDPESLHRRCVEVIAQLILTSYAPGVITPDYPELLPELMADPNWYLGDEGLVLVAPEYSLGSLSLGMPRFTVPYEELEELLYPELLPIPRQELVGRLQVSAEAMEDPLCTIDCGEGEGVLSVTADGPVFDLKLERLSYFHQGDGSFVPVMEGLAAGLSRLEEGESWVLQGLVPSPVPYMRLRWRLGNGITRSWLLGLDTNGELLFESEY